MNIIYNISIWLYLMVMHVLSLFNHKAKLWIEGRKGIFSELKEKIQKNQNIVWFHCASLGEFEQAKPMIQAYRLKFPKHKILLTFFSPSGFHNIKQNNLVDWIFFLPADTKSNAKKFINLVNPVKAIFIKYEFWFNYIQELKKNNIALYSVSSVFRDNQLFFKYKWFARKLYNITHFFVQDKKSAQLLKSIGLKNHTISGDTRFDSVLANIQNFKKMPLIEKFCKNTKTIICGSTWRYDEILLVKYIKNHKKINFIIATHELSSVSDLQKKTGGLLYSKANKNNILTTNVLIIDSIGLLSNVYKYGDLAYIGGGFGSGIHNILEAVTFGLPVIFGPNYKKFNEAICLIKKKGAISISNYEELKIAINTFNNFDKNIALDYIKENSGATKKILRLMN